MGQKKYFLWLEGIRGEIKIPGHVGQIELLSFHEKTGGRNPTVECDKRTDSTSPVLKLAMMEGKEIRIGVIDIENYEGGELRHFHRISLSKVLVSAFKTGSPAHQEGPAETFELTCREIAHM